MDDAAINNNSLYMENMRFYYNLFNIFPDGIRDKLFEPETLPFRLRYKVGSYILLAVMYCIFCAVCDIINESCEVIPVKVSDTHCAIGINHCWIAKLSPAYWIFYKGLNRRTAIYLFNVAGDYIEAFILMYPIFLIMQIYENSAFDYFRIATLLPKSITIILQSLFSPISLAITAFNRITTQITTRQNLMMARKKYAMKKNNDLNVLQ